MLSFTPKSLAMGYTYSPQEQEDGPRFELAIENELLMMKLNAEFGAECITNGEQLPPALVNEFLRSVYAFEQQFRQPLPLIRVFDKIGKPAFYQSEELSDGQVRRELKRLLALLRRHRMELEVLGEYPERQIYRFITEEFFDHEIESLDLPGYTSHFCYEEFHPNHEMDIRQLVQVFVTHWLEKKLDVYTIGLADDFLYPDGHICSREVVIRKINCLFEAFTAFFGANFRLGSICIDAQAQQGSLTARVEGMVSYQASMENGEVLVFEGAVQFFLSNTKARWEIFYFVFPGFSGKE